MISNFAGSGIGSFFGEDAPARSSVWRFPEAMVADAAGNLIIADTGNLRVRRIDFPLPPPPATAIRAILNTFSAGAVISGFSLATIFGENFIAEPLTWDSALAEGRLPFELGGVRVTVNNRAAAISYVGPGQINIVVPLDLTSGPVPVEVTGPNGRGNATAFMADVSPALLTRKIGEHTSPYAQFAGESVQVAPPGVIPDTETRPAREGDFVDFIATGLGLTDPVPPEGVTFESPFPLADLSRLAVTIGDKPAPVEAALMVSPGTYLVRIRIPEAPGSGEQPIRLEVRGVAAQPNLTLSLE
ncbi:MAG: hypothetical protein JNN08_06360 [Bryobacterales bacterium]|nr:hypothetical protein [Bryobacterales bacterium]